MRRSMILWVGIALIVLGLLGMAMVMVYRQAATVSGRFPSPGRAPGIARGVDAHFIEQMIPHHDDAIAMADLGIERGEHPELRSLARTIKQTQTAENTQMREWYREWFGAEVPTSTAGPPGRRRGMMRNHRSDLRALEDAEQFDKEFLEQMIEHHQMALAMSRMAGSATNRQEMRDFTDTIFETQSREIQQMQRWHREWYGADGRPGDDNQGVE